MAIHEQSSHIIDASNDPENAYLFCGDDPEEIFDDQIEIDHGIFGAVYCVSQGSVCVRGACVRACVCVSVCIPNHWFNRYFI